MATLIIKDLPLTEPLDACAMSRVNGGNAQFAAPIFDWSKLAMSFDAQQLIGQSQNTVVNTGVSAAYASGIASQVAPRQTAQNLNVLNIGLA
jgi:hypothetical protein